MQRYVCITLMVGGCLLLVVEVFAPRLGLYTSFGDSAGEHSYGPWSLLSGATSAAVPQLLFIVVPLALLAFLAIAGAALVVLFLVGAPDALGLKWPYYSTRGVVYGAWAAVAGFACISLSAFTIVRHTPLESRKQATSC